MNKFKKFLAVALSLCLLGGSMATLGGCKDEEPTPTPPPAIPQTVEVTLSVKTDKGVALSGVKFAVWANVDVSKVGDLETNADGKASVNVVAGEYDVELNSDTLPEGYIPQTDGFTSRWEKTGAEYTCFYVWTIDVDKAQEFSIVVENLTPDGTAEKPYFFAVDENDEASVTIPANATVYYECRNISGASLFVETEGVEVVYDGVTYTYNTQKGYVEVPLAKTDANSRAKFALVNKTNGELAVEAYMRAPEGSLKNPIVLTTLGEITVEVDGQGQVYYQWTASEAGTLTIASNSETSYIVVSNKTQTDSDTVGNREGDEQTLKPTIEITVNAGDVISIQASAFGAVDGQNYTYEITLSFQASLS